MSTLVRSSSSDMLHSGRWRETAAGRDESISDRAAATSVSGSTRPRPGTRASTLNFRKAVSQDIAMLAQSSGDVLIEGLICALELALSSP
jgi:hypothetical protein